MNSARIGNYTVFFDNTEEYHKLRREVWGGNLYYVDPEELDERGVDTSKMTILDLGAHIGLSTLYFARLFPGARIVSVEPVPENAAFLRKNVFENLLEQVLITEVAVSDQDGEGELYVDASPDRWYSTAGIKRGAWNGEQESKIINVQTRTLTSILQEYRPSIVKMDIEGAETDVIKQAQDEVSGVEIWLIEFHPIEGKGMEEIVQTFEERGYRVQVTKGGKTVPWHKARGLSLITARKK